MLGPDVGCGDGPSWKDKRRDGSEQTQRLEHSDQNVNMKEVDFHHIPSECDYKAKIVGSVLNHQIKLDNGSQPNQQGHRGHADTTVHGREHGTRIISKN